MKVVGIVVEYNPLHHGHMVHIKKTLALSKADCLVAVMSGNVVQRGEFSLVNKFTKTKWALHAGVDLVIELPSVYSLQSADLFAQTSVELLSKLGVSELYFGSESGQIEPLVNLLETLESDAYQTLLKHFLDQGNSYPTSSNLAIKELNQDEAYNQPNNILGIQYLKAIKTLNLPMKAYTFKRESTGYYDEINENLTIQSASAIRKSLKGDLDVKHYVPHFVYKDLLNVPLYDLEMFYPYLKYIHAVKTPKEIETIFGMEEGLENRFLNVKSFTSVEDYINQIISPRYTYAKIKRSLMHFLLDIKKEDIALFNPPYLRILGMNEQGQILLNQVKKTLDIPLITKMKQARHPYLEIELRISKLMQSVTDEDLLRQEFKPLIIF
ncbi:MAG: nucleotidyltransferase [Candidatus Izemoplasmataceae bacterium]